MVSHELREKHFLQVKDKKRYTYPLVFNNLIQNCYVLYCRNEDDAMHEAFADGTYKLDGENDYDG